MDANYQQPDTTKINATKTVMQTLALMDGRVYKNWLLQMHQHNESVKDQNER